MPPQRRRVADAAAPLRYSVADCSHDCMASSGSVEHSLALPRSVSVRSDRPLQHVAVHELENLALPQADLCSELTWQLPGADFQQAVRIKRCAQFVTVVDRTNAGGAANASGRAITGLLITTNAGSLGMSMADPFTGQELQTEITTHVAARRSGADSLNLSPAMDLRPLAALISGRLAESRTCVPAERTATWCKGGSMGAQQVDILLECNQHRARNVSAVMAAASAIATQRVDVAEGQPDTINGFASTLLLPRATAAASGATATASRALMASLTGAAQIGSVARPRVNLASALLIAVAAVTMYFVAQLRDEPAVHIAQRCYAQHDDPPPGAIDKANGGAQLRVQQSPGAAAEAAAVAAAQTSHG